MNFISAENLGCADKRYGGFLPCIMECTILSAGYDGVVSEEDEMKCIVKCKKLCQTLPIEDVKQ